MIPETHIEEEERQRQLNKVFGKLREFEEDPYRPSTTSSSTGSGMTNNTGITGSSGGVTQSNFNKTTSGGG